MSVFVWAFMCVRLSGDVCVYLTGYKCTLFCGCVFVLCVSLALCMPIRELLGVKRDSLEADRGAV